MTRLLRILRVAEARDGICWQSECERDPCFRIATPLGGWDSCDEHSDDLLASLPEEFIRCWERPPKVALNLPEDGIPF